MCFKFKILESPFSVIVLTQPHIEQAIDQNPRVINNNSVIIDCPVLGYPAPEVVWLKDNHVLNLNEDPNLLLEPPYNLKIKKVSVGI